VTPEFERWLSEQRTKDREQLTEEVATGIGMLFSSAEHNRENNCYYCMLFDRETDTCRPMKIKPPTFVLVHGCWQFHHIKDIPY
jgi:hypothetical protein